MLNKVIIFSAPSGSGKTTVVNHLLATMPKLSFSVSATTRKPREGEQNGREYYFLEKEDFLQKINNNEFLEHEEVYKGLYYGTLKSEVERIWSQGKTVVFDVDVVGGLNIKKEFGDAALAVFLRPPSMDVLMDRLTKRSTEVEHQLKERLDKAKFEFQFETKYDSVLINDKLEDTFVNAEKLVTDFINS
ncbi:MAG: guanylate kinase [Bacteroidia bacterium]|nr:guanylate kinase [Bacteroidia bacterium]